MLAGFLISAVGDRSCQQGYDIASQHDRVAMVEVDFELLPSTLHAGIIVKVGWRGSINRVYLFT